MMSLIFSVWTVVVLILFIGIVAWAWSGRNRDRFDEAARIPLREDDEETVRDDNREEQDHG